MANKGAAGFNLSFIMELEDGGKSLQNASKMTKRLEKDVQRLEKVENAYEASQREINKLLKTGNITKQQGHQLNLKLSKDYKKLTGDSSKLTAQLRKQRSEHEKLTKAQALKQGLTGRLQGIAGNIGLGGLSGTGLMAGAGAGAALYGGKKIADAINAQQQYQRELGRNAELLGMTQRGLAGVNFALGRLAGMSAEDVTENLMDLRERLGEIASDPKSALGKDAAAIGLDARSLEGRGVTEQLREVVRALKSQANPERQLFYARSLFGDQAARMLTQATADSAKLEALIERGEKNAALMNEKSLQSWQNIKDGLAEPINVMKKAAADMASAGVDILAAATLNSEDQREFIKENYRRGRVEDEIKGFMNPEMHGLRGPAKRFMQPVYRPNDALAMEDYNRSKDTLDRTDVKDYVMWAMSQHYFVGDLVTRVADNYMNRNQNKHLLQSGYVGQKSSMNRLFRGSVNAMLGGDQLGNYTAGMRSRTDHLVEQMYGDRDFIEGMGVLKSLKGYSPNRDPSRHISGYDPSRSLNEFVNKMDSLMTKHETSAGKYGFMRSGKLSGEDRAVTEMKFRHQQELAKELELIGKSNLDAQDAYLVKAKLKAAQEKELELLERQIEDDKRDAARKAKFGAARSKLESAMSQIGMGKMDSIDKLMKSYAEQKAKIESSGTFGKGFSGGVGGGGEEYRIIARIREESRDRRVEQDLDKKRNVELQKLNRTTSQKLGKMIKILNDKEKMIPVG